jgi:hypothetical protein
LRRVLGSIEGEYRRYKQLAERAMEQMADDELSIQPHGGGNSVTTVVWHIAGNFLSRFTGFPEADGEKTWRDRDDEFLPRTVTRKELLEHWENGWNVLLISLSGLTDRDLERTVTIRGVPLSIVEALHRSLGHAAYHVGQIVFLAKERRGDRWNHLSIPPGGSAGYNRNPTGEKPPS